MNLEGGATSVIPDLHFPPSMIPDLKKKLTHPLNVRYTKLKHSVLLNIRVIVSGSKPDQRGNNQSRWKMRKSKEETFGLAPGPDPQGSCAAMIGVTGVSQDSYAFQLYIGTRYLTPRE